MRSFLAIGRATRSLSRVSDDERNFRQPRFRRPPGACEILLVRHGESAPAVEGEAFPLVDGHGDPPLDPAGREQAERVADRLQHEDIAAIYVTTLQRTAQTAAPLAARLGIEPQVEPDLREVFLGDWEGGIFRKHVAEGHPLALKMFETQRWDAIPGAESSEALSERVRAGVERIAAAHPDQLVMVVAHGGVIGRILADACGATSGFAFVGTDNGAISRIVVTGDRWIIRGFNDTGHLDTLVTDDPVGGDGADTPVSA
jgi:2,3-bisphosphoglycerate-dependent phosphoglycerate mutase